MTVSHHTGSLVSFAHDPTATIPDNIGSQTAAFAASSLSAPVLRSERRGSCWQPRFPEIPGGGVEALGESEEAAVAVDLVERIACGDAAAESALVDRYSRVLTFFLRRQTHDLALADDLHQETFCIVLLRLRRSRLGEPEKLANFLYRTARNLVIAQYRKAARQQTFTAEEGIERTVEKKAPSPLDSVLLHEQASLVRQMIEEIKSQRDRELLYRYYVAEEEKEALCSDLDLSHRHFDRVLFRARQRLKELLQHFEKRQRLLEAR